MAHACYGLRPIEEMEVGSSAECECTVLPSDKPLSSIVQGSDGLIWTKWSSEATAGDDRRGSEVLEGGKSRVSIGESGNFPSICFSSFFELSGSIRPRRYTGC